MGPCCRLGRGPHPLRRPGGGFRDAALVVACDMRRRANEVTVLLKIANAHPPSVHRMQQRQVVGWALVAIVGCTVVLPALALPHQVQQQQQLQQQHRQYPVYQHQQQAEARKYAEKPNAMKKVPIDNDLDDIQTNQISVRICCEK